MLAFYSGDEKTTFGQRAQAYLKATEAVATRYPNDDEAQIAYAITLNVTAPPESLTDRETDRRHVRFLANI
ncbi:hypothetical protein AAFX91_22200 [Bradyrhizobium sp. 31Argb]|uniref:hypothetical protein n=1 Tax=unclassified Bradyrhizobium TaxID=2631580 RepID=UPI001FDF2E2C|nr:hypothetical protein [Bradyrhizobium sp. Leo170]